MPRGVNAAIQAAAIVHPTAIETACSAIKTRLGKLKVHGWGLDKLIKAVEALLPHGDYADDLCGSRRFVRTILDQAPVAEDVQIPDGWDLNEKEVSRISPKDEVPNVPTPVVITRRFTGSAHRLNSSSWHGFGMARWFERIVPRAELASTRSIVELAAYGLPVTSNNASELVQYLADFEAINLEILPCDYTAQQLGWLGTHGADGFLWGRRVDCGR